MWCQTCGREGSGRFCRACGSPLISGTDPEPGSDTVIRPLPPISEEVREIPVPGYQQTQPPLPQPPQPPNGPGVLIASLVVGVLLVLLAAGGVWWGVDRVRAAARSATPTGVPRSPSATDSAQPAPSGTDTRPPTTSAPSPDPNDPYLQGWVLVIHNCEQNECTRQQTWEQAVELLPWMDFEVVDSNRYTGLRPGVWAVLVRDRTWPTRASAVDACSAYGLEAGKACYPRDPSRSHPKYQ